MNHRNKGRHSADARASKRRQLLAASRSRNHRLKKNILFFAALVAIPVIMVFTLIAHAVSNSSREITKTAAAVSYAEAEPDPDEISEEILTSEAPVSSEEVVIVFEVYEESYEVQEDSSPAEDAGESMPASEDTADAEEAETAFITSAITKEGILEKFAELQEIFPEGKYWNHRGVTVEDGADTCYMITDTPCWHGKYQDVYCNRYDGATKELFPQYGYLTQCLAYASFVSDYIFGEDAPLTVFYDYDQLQIGDHIRITSLMHSVTVTEKTDDYVTVMEVDADGVQCQIGWGRQITRATLESYGSNVMYITRYEIETE